MRWGLLVLVVVLLLLPMVSANSASGTVSIEVINPGYEQEAQTQQSLEVQYLEQEAKKQEEAQSNLLTGQVVSDDLSTQSNLVGVFWFLGLLALILILYLVRRLLKIRKS